MNKFMNIRDEEVLLLELCRLEFSVECIGKIRELWANITDWKYFSSLANSHGVAALIYHNLERLQLLNRIPEEVITFLRERLLLNISRNAFNTQAIGEVLRLLNSENIRTVLLKGFALEFTVYGNNGLRQMSDVDILTERDQCIRARNILIRNGYISLPVKSILHKLIIRHTGKHLPSLIRNGTSVEIHHELFSNKKNALTKMLMETSYEILIKGEKAYVPQPQIFFLYLVKHLHIHEMNNESQLRLYADLVILIEKYRDNIINSDLLKYASETGMSEILACRLEPLRDLWGVPFPALINDFIDKWVSSGSINKFVFFLKNPKGNPPIDKPWVYRQIIYDIPGIHRKVLFILGDIFPSLSFMKKRYNCNSKLSALKHYPHRLGKILWLIKR